jgi:hypothetical protein
MQWGVLLTVLISAPDSVACLWEARDVQDMFGCATSRYQGLLASVLQGLFRRYLLQKREGETHFTWAARPDEHLVFGSRQVKWLQ